jgi:colanic acid/amylovoran biosynthesis protein
MHILITNFHSIKNKGDLGIVLGLMRGIRAKCPEATFSLIGQEASERQWWQDRGVTFFTPFFKYKPKNRLSFIVFLIRYFVTLITARFSSNGIITAYQTADVVISKGGSFFREPEYRRNWLPVGILSHLHQLLIAKNFKKKIILSAQSFGPINNPVTRLILRHYFKKFNLITVRDSDSAFFLEKALGLTDVAVVGDSAFLLSSSEDNKNKNRLKQKTRRVGLTVRSWGHQDQYRNYCQSIADLIDRYASQQFEFIFMPQVVGPRPYEDDRLVAREIVDLLKPETRGCVTVMDEELDPKALIDLYRQTDFFIATRLHSAIFALINNRPLIAIGYEPKTKGVLGDLGLGQCVIDIRLISKNKIIEKFEQLLVGSNDIFYQASEQAKQLAQKNIDLIFDHI